MRGVSVSSDQNIVAFAVDTVGRRIYTIRFRDLDTGEFLPDEIREAVQKAGLDQVTVMEAGNNETNLPAE